MVAYTEGMRAATDVVMGRRSLARLRGSASLRQPAEVNAFDPDVALLARGSEALSTRWARTESADRASY